MELKTNKIENGVKGNKFLKEENGIIYYLNNSWVDFSMFPKNNKSFKWKECNGLVFNFNCADVCGSMKIIDVKPYKSGGYTITIKYNKIIKDVVSFRIYKSSWLQQIVFPHGIFLYQLGQRVVDDKRDYTIIDRKYKKVKRKNGENEYKHLYLIHCNICNSDLWIPYSSIKNDDYKCSCCNSKIIIPGINDICTTDPWMTPYFQGGEEEAKFYTHRSSKAIYPICPNCGKISEKKYTINYIYDNHGFSCICNDNIKYPEKIMINILEQLHIKYIRQLSCNTFKWVKRYLYDFYLLDYNVIVETHGNQHYSTSTFTFKGGRTYLEEQENDRLKKELALNNNISNYIILDCRKSNIEWIKKSIMNSILPKLLKFTENDINWSKCEDFAASSLMIDVVDFYNNNNNNCMMKDIASYFGLTTTVVRNFLIKGNNVGICKYETYGGAKYSHCKPIRCIEKDQKFLGVEDCSEKFMKEYGIKLKAQNISKAIKTNKAYHGFHFEYINKDGYLKELFNNKIN